MSFYGQFMSRFPRELQNTEAVKAWAAVGVDTEKTLLEQISAQVRGMTDINGFYPDLYRSWLAFFLRAIPNAFAPRAVVTVTNPAGSIYPVVIPSSYATNNPSALVSSGVRYVQPSNITISPGSSIQFEAIQGTVVRSSGTYSEIIVISTNKVDLSTIQLTVDNKVVQPVSLMSSWTGMKFRGTWVPSLNDQFPTQGQEAYNKVVHIYDGISYDHKGDFYLVTATGIANITDINTQMVRQETFYAGQYVMYDGSTWSVSTNEPSLLPKQMDSSYVIPYDGYYAYYQEGSLYIKVFPGPSTADPEGLNYEVTFIDTDGGQGTVKADSLSYVSPVKDTHGNVVQVTVKNEKSSLGYSITDAGELCCLLRERLFASINISSVPEYTAFFNAQPEVGDCKVLSDFERDDRGQVVDTGYVSVYFLDSSGEPITAESGESLLQILCQRVSYYRDIAALRATAPVKVESVLRIRYLSSSDDTALVTAVSNTVTNYYDLSFLKQNGLSLFEDLDLAKVALSIGNIYNVVGLFIEAFHFKSVPTFSGTDFATPPYTGEELGTGYYLYYAGGSTVPVKLTELPDPANSGSVSIVDSNNNIVGSRTATSVTITNSAFPLSSGKMECYWSMKDKGILTVGKTDGVRALASDCIDGAIVITRY